MADKLINIDESLNAVDQLLRQCLISLTICLCVPVVHILQWVRNHDNSLYQQCYLVGFHIYPYRLCRT